MKYDPVLCMMVEDGVRTNDSFNAKKIAQYLWTWEDVYALSGAAQSIVSELDDMDNTSKTMEEHREFIRKNYKKVLDRYYSAVKSEVNNILKSGYSNIEKALMR